MIAIARRYRLTGGDWLGAGAVAGGIALFLAVSPPSDGTRAPCLAAWAPVILAAGAFAAIAGMAAVRARGTAQVIWLAPGAGITYGVLDALTKSTVDLPSSPSAPSSSARGCSADGWPPHPGQLAAQLAGG